MEKDFKPKPSSSTCKMKHKVSFTKEKNKSSQHEVPRHEYFSAHQCYLPADKLNRSQIRCGALRKCVLNLTAVHMEDIRAQNLYRLVRIMLIPRFTFQVLLIAFYIVKLNDLPVLRSYAALCAERYRQYKYYPLSIHPFSKIRIWCEAFFLIGLVSSNVALAVYVSTTYPQNTHQRLLVMYLFDVIYVSNIVLNFFTGYIDGNTYQYIVLDLKKIAFKYARTWLVVDLMSAFCFLPAFTQIENVYPQLILMSMKLLRVPIIVVYLNNVLTVLRTGIYSKTLIEIFVLILTYLTWNIFFQFTVEYMKEGTFNPVNPSNCSWMSIGKIWHEDSVTRFTYSFDRAVGMLRKNSNINLMEQHGCYENFFIVAWLIAKLLVYHCILKYTVSLFGSESAKAKYYTMTKQVQTLMNQKRFPPRIKKKILKFYAIRFQSHFFAESKMLACVTGQLREDIIMHTGRQLVRELEFLKHLPRSLLLQIEMKLKIVIFIAGDIIFKINTVGDCLYFIDKGSVAIYSESGSEICHLEDGDYFGEIALVMKRCIRTASAVAVTNCELFRLDKEDFDSSIACYPTLYERIKKVAINRYERTCVLDEHHKAELKMAKEHDKRFSDTDHEGDRNKPE